MLVYTQNQPIGKLFLKKRGVEGWIAKREKGQKFSKRRKALVTRYPSAMAAKATFPEVVATSKG